MILAIIIMGVGLIVLFSLFAITEIKERYQLDK